MLRRSLCGVILAWKVLVFEKFELPLRFVFLAGKPNSRKEARTMSESYRKSLLLAMDRCLPPGFFRGGRFVKELGGRRSGWRG
jgi:hypothetical protein